jgi:hypothetical protein
MKFMLKAARSGFSAPEPAAFRLYDDCARHFRSIARGAKGVCAVGQSTCQVSLRFPPLLSIRPSNLSVFDDLNDHVLTHRAFKRTLVVIRLVGLNSREPHRDVAHGALRVFDSVSINEVGYLH